MRTARGFGYLTTILATVLMMAGASAPSPFYPELAQSLGLPAFGVTVVFAVYAITLLVTLVVLGSLSDLVGRRPVISVGFVVLAASVVVFWHADSFTMLIVARAVQGVATGALLATLSAAVVDFEPADGPGSSATWNSVAAMLGLAVGAIAAGVLLDVAADPETAVFGPLVSLYAVIAVAIWFVPETSPRAGTIGATLRPQLLIPRGVRPLVLVSVPAIVAGWSTGGLFLALGPTVVRHEFSVSAHVWQGATIGALAGAGALAGVLVRRRSARFITLFGTSALAAGTALSLIALGAHSLPAYVAAVLVVGAGFGTAFAGVLRSVLPAVDPEVRAGTLSTIFVISYLAFGVPSMLAGMLVPELTLGLTMTLFGGIVVILGVAATGLRLRSAV